MMNTTEVRERVPEGMVEELETLNSTMKVVHATLVNALDRYAVVEDVISELDSTNVPGTGDLDDELMEAIGLDEVHVRLHAVAALVGMYTDSVPDAFGADFEEHGIGMPSGYEQHAQKKMDVYYDALRAYFKQEREVSA